MPSPKYIVGQLNKCGLFTHIFNMFIAFAPSLTSKKKEKKGKNSHPLTQIVGSMVSLIKIL
jgi:hypothetical protein